MLNTDLHILNISNHKHKPQINLHNNSAIAANTVSESCLFFEKLPCWVLPIFCCIHCHLYLHIPPSFIPVPWANQQQARVRRRFTWYIEAVNASLSHVVLWWWLWMTYGLHFDLSYKPEKFHCSCILHSKIMITRRLSTDRPINNCNSTQGCLFGRYLVCHDISDSQVENNASHAFRGDDLLYDYSLTEHNCHLVNYCIHL